MDVSSIGSSAGLAQLAQARGEYATRVLKKSLDIAAQGAAQLAQMIGQDQGVGRNVDVVG